jgi:hypothetical protein
MNTHLYLYAILVTLLTGNALSAQDTLRKGVFEFILIGGVSFDAPIKNRTPQLDNFFSYDVTAAYFPNRQVPVGMEFRGSFGTYAKDSEMLRHTVEGIPNTQVDIDLTSELHKMLVGVKFADLSSQRRFRPFASVHAGRIFFRSGIRASAPVVDEKCPEEDDETQVLENELVHEFKGWAFGGRAGVEVLLCGNPSRRDGQLLFYASGSLLRSFQNVEYINVEHLLDEVPEQTMDGSTLRNGQSASGSSAGEALPEGYIHVSAQSVPFRKVAELHRAPLQLVGFNAGLIMRF